MRATIASNCSRAMFDSNVGRSRSAGAGTSAGVRRGTGPASAPRTSAIVARGLLVGALDVGLGLEVGVGDDRDRVLEMVEDDERVGEHQRHVGQTERIRVRERRGAGAGGSPSGSTVRTRS